MIVEVVNFKRVIDIIQAWWAKSMIAVILFVLGLWIGTVNTEYRIATDCKFAGAFRVDIQAFVCQRKL